MRLKFLLLLSILFFGISLAQSKSDLLEVEKINKYSESIDHDPNVVEYKFQVSNKGKNVYYKYLKKQKKIVRISREWNESIDNYLYTYTDYFLLRNGEKIYASQSIVSKNKSDPEDIGGWSVQFWINKNKILHITSLGHGKTEDEDWDFEKELKENFNYMLEKVRKNEKNK